MRKRLLAILTIMAMLLVSGPAEIFAATESDAAQATDNDVVYAEDVQDETAEEVSDAELATDEAVLTGETAEEPVEATETTTTTTTTTTKTETLPAPTNLKAYAGYKRVTLQWKAVDGATAYVIKRALKGKKNYKTIATVKAPKHKYVNKVKVDKTYKYKVYAKKGKTVSTKCAKVTGAAFWQIHYKITFRIKRTLYTHTKARKKATFKAGYTTEAIDFDDGRYVFKYKGRTYYVTRISCCNQKVSQINTKKTYSVREARDFVKQKKLSSRTQYLIFVNTYTQHEYVFKGKKGSWKIVWHDDIATGRASTPTDTGLTSIKTKSPVENGLRYWSMTTNFSIHGLPGGAKVNYPTSGACVRNYDNRAKWVYDNCAKGTAVYVY